HAVRPVRSGTGRRLPDPVLGATRRTRRIDRRSVRPAVVAVELLPAKLAPQTPDVLEQFLAEHVADHRGHAEAQEEYLDGRPVTKAGDRPCGHPGAAQPLARRDDDEIPPRMRAHEELPLSPNMARVKD